MDPREQAAYAKTYDEIYKYARGEQADKLRSKYAPEPTEPEAVEAAPAAGAEAQADAELDQESLSRLAAMAE